MITMTNRRRGFALLLSLLTLLALLSPAATAAPRCFAETNQCLDG